MASKLLDGFDMATILEHWQNPENRTLKMTCEAIGLDGESQNYRNALSSYISQLRKVSPAIADKLVVKKRGRSTEILDEGSILDILAGIGGLTEVAAEINESTAELADAMENLADKVAPKAKKATPKAKKATPKAKKAALTA